MRKACSGELFINRHHPLAARSAVQALTLPRTAGRAWGPSAPLEGRERGRRRTQVGITDEFTGQPEEGLLKVVVGLG